MREREEENIFSSVLSLGPPVNRWPGSPANAEPLDGVAGMVRVGAHFFTRAL